MNLSEWVADGEYIRELATGFTAHVHRASKKTATTVVAVSIHTPAATTHWADEVEGVKE